MAMKRMCLLGVLRGVGDWFHAVLGPYFDTFHFDYPMYRRRATSGGARLNATE